MSHDHGDHHHHEHGSELSEMQLRTRALETILLEKGYIDPAALDVLIETYEKKIGPRNGAQVVAKAWTDPAYRKWLFADGTAAGEAPGFRGGPRPHLGRPGGAPAGGPRNPRLGFTRRVALSGSADAPRRHRRLERGPAGRTGHARQHDRHWLGETAEGFGMNGAADM